MRQLAELWIVQTPSKKLRGLDASPSLSTLELSHCSKLESIDALPKSLLKFKVEKRLTYLGFANVLDGNLAPLLKNPSLDRVGFSPEKRKHYTHSAEELNTLLAAATT